MDTSATPRFQGLRRLRRSEARDVARKRARPIAPDGAAHTWKITYDRGRKRRRRLTVGRGTIAGFLSAHAGDAQSRGDLQPLRPLVHEGGGTASRVWLDDLDILLLT